MTLVHVFHIVQMIREAVHPPRPGWYEEFYATVMNTTMHSYEAQVCVNTEVKVGGSKNVSVREIALSKVGYRSHYLA